VLKESGFTDRCGPSHSATYPCRRLGSAGGPARQEGIGPSTCGFGSRCSATELLSYALQSAASPLGHATTVGHEGLEPSTSGVKTQRPEPLDQCPLRCPGFFETGNSGEDDRDRTGGICLDRAAFYR
jgi:hypothetical protein